MTFNGNKRKSNGVANSMTETQTKNVICNTENAQVYYGDLANTIDYGNINRKTHVQNKTLKKIYS